MCNQLARRTNDIKKNITGLQRYLEVLQKRTNVASDNKGMLLTEALEQNTKRMCALQVTNSDEVRAL